ncbi:MAG: hypothetical protein GYB68_15610, partial [Chloroflexi bacterium]|nr:hypothetical protein [Chloroflexota bacterium]
MPTLRHWLDNELDRLVQRGKRELAEAFVDFNQRYFEPDYEGALAAIEPLYNLIHLTHEPLWSAVVGYYHASANLAWKGDLATAWRQSNNAYVQAAQQRGQFDALTIYLQELLLSAHLSVDGPGYAVEVLAALESMPRPLPEDVQQRINLIKAQAFAAQGHPCLLYTS